MHKKLETRSLLQRAAGISPKGDAVLVQGQERSNVTAVLWSRAISSKSEPRPINPCATQTHRHEGAAGHLLWVRNSPKTLLACSKRFNDMSSLPEVDPQTLLCNQNISPNQVLVANLRAASARSRCANEPEGEPEQMPNIAAVLEREGRKEFGGGLVVVFFCDALIP